jgi:hypothetical protein
MADSKSLVSAAVMAGVGGESPLARWRRAAGFFEILEVSNAHRKKPLYVQRYRFRVASDLRGPPAPSALGHARERRIQSMGGESVERSFGSARLSQQSEAPFIGLYRGGRPPGRFQMYEIVAGGAANVLFRN